MELESKGRANHERPPGAREGAEGKGELPEVFSEE